MLTVSQAINLILAETLTGLSETVPTEAALNRVLSSPVLTPHDSPPFDKSLMDGFAVNSASLVMADVSDGKISGENTVGDTISFNVCETLTAGTHSEKWLSEGQAVRVMTGTAIPPGADCVVPIEHVTVFPIEHIVQTSDVVPTTQSQSLADNPQVISIPRRTISKGYSVLRKGESARSGDVLLTAGVRLYAQHLAALAEFGITEIQARRRPRCAVLATGDELVEYSRDPGPGRIRNSNEPMLLGQLRQNYAEPVGLGIARDDHEVLRSRIQQGLKCDFLILTGGVSVGIRDLVPVELEAAGVRKVFHGVHMKPGKPLWFGVYEKGDHRCCVFGLPGNPVSSLACFELFVRPALRKFSGICKPDPSPMKAILTEPYQVRGDRPVYHPVKIEAGDQGLTVRPLRWMGSADLRATVDANGMALFEPSGSPIAEGTMVSVWLWAGLNE